VEGLRRARGAELTAATGEELVWLALKQLARGRLLTDRVRRPGGATRVTRRELLRRLGLAAAASLPLVTSVVAPTPAQAASLRGSGQPCTSPLECASGVCSSGACA
jgi:hypothetical protein